MSARRLPRRGVGVALLAVALGGALVAPAWFVLIEHTGGPGAQAAPGRSAGEPLPRAAPPVAPPRASLPQAARPPVAPDEPGLVEGRVLDQQGLLPQVGVDVTARPARHEGLPGVLAGERATSDPEGRFQLCLRPGAWWVGVAGREQLCQVVPGSTQALELLVPVPAPALHVQLLGPDGASLSLPAALVEARQGPLRASGRGQARDGPGVRVPGPSVTAGPLLVRVWPGDPRWEPWEGELAGPGPLRVRLAPASGFVLRLGLAADQERADVLLRDLGGQLLAQRAGVGLADDEAGEADEDALWTGAGQVTPLPAGGREVRLAVGLPAGVTRVRVEATAHRLRRAGESAALARSRAEAVFSRAETDPVLDLR